MRYSAQAVAANNLVVANGGRGIEVFSNISAPVYVKQNTTWGNNTDPNQSGLGCGDVAVKVSSDVQFSNNLISTRSATGCGGHAIYASDVSQGDGSDSFVSNVLYGYNGYNEFSWNSGSFTYASSNITGVFPNFTNPVNPGAPNCGGTANVTSCMSSVINNFVPKTSSVQGYGYQRPSSGSVHDTLFPRWLCTANVPSGLITMGCS